MMSINLRFLIETFTRSTLILSGRISISSRCSANSKLCEGVSIVIVKFECRSSSKEFVISLLLAAEERLCRIHYSFYGFFLLSIIIIPEVRQKSGL